MATLKGFDKIVGVIDKAVRKSLQGKVTAFVKANAERQLTWQRDKEGEPMPEKAESTKRQYRRKGWNTEKFLVRTGQSTKMVANWDGGDWVIYPQGQTRLGYHITPDDGPARTRWVQPTQALYDEINKIISEEIARALKS